MLKVITSEKLLAVSKEQPGFHKRKVSGAKMSEL